MSSDDSEKATAATITIPCGMLESTALPIVALLNPTSSSSDPASTVLVASAPVPISIAKNSQWFLPSFSSIGPTRDGRIKPDIVAPGQFIQSVNSDASSGSFNCAETATYKPILQLSGTRCVFFLFLLLLVSLLCCMCMCESVCVCAAMPGCAVFLGGSWSGEKWWLFK